MTPDKAPNIRPMSYFWAFRFLNSEASWFFIVFGFTGVASGCVLLSHSARTAASKVIDGAVSPLRQRASNSNLTRFIEVDLPGAPEV